MRVKRAETDVLTPDQRTRLRLLVDGVPDDASQGHPDFIALLDFWESCRVPWDGRLAVPCYRARGGVWLIESVRAVVSGIGRYVAGATAGSYASSGPEIGQSENGRV